MHELAAASGISTALDHTQLFILVMRDNLGSRTSFHGTFEFLHLTLGKRYVDGIFLRQNVSQRLGAKTQLVIGFKLSTAPAPENLINTLSLRYNCFVARSIKKPDASFFDNGL